MNKSSLLALACLACGVAAAAGPFEQFKGKMKEGMYEYKMDTDMGSMPGMPQGMPKTQSSTFKRCLTQQDIDKGAMSRGPRDAKGNDNCEIKNMNVSGNTATYTMECKGDHAMKGDNKITFTGDGYKMDTKMQMQMQGQTMNMSHHMEAKYLGPCK